ncbi:prepilin peptidase [Sedimentibacter sp. MB31-C6]|uniref:prepilin peptidase n=1 Tax=Sedimentibacter sp. MB31-C6 TaxID=3109366 RepID=UPI002DDD3DBD|nr:prepilin peptidase [Sedimentibacter sp. MB36-C1]WSI05594.1 prepilin peptidase [Sedimentibacter sp. MB36-C1]
MAYIDYKQKIIPDKLNIIIVLLGIINTMIDFKNCKVYIALAAIIFTVFLFIAIVTDGGIGGGDIKLLTALSLIFGISMLEIIIFALLIASIISIYLIIVRKQKYNSSIALGPYICIGVFVSLIDSFL